WAEQLKYPKLLRQHNLDMMHFTNFNVPIFYRRKFIVTIHDITPWFFPGPNVRKSLIRKLGYNLTFKLGIKKAWKILVPSEHTKKQLIGHFKIPKDKIKVIYLGATHFSKVQNNDKIVKKYGILKPYLFYVGVWRDHKNLDTLVEAFNKIKAQHDVQLILAGQEDKAYPETRQAIEQSSYKSDILTPGFVPGSDLAALYSSAEIYVLPSFNEGFGLGALEATNYGTPVIASSTTSVPEILGDSALYFDPQSAEELAEAANKLLSDKKLSAKIVAKSQAKIKRYDWQTTADKTLQIYHG
ncbi:MAG: hypothetical protein COT81_02735, partial [Candidatus Buchananbacteria bacterium CG10_big_fil_rev_8_21_14_0_10_42_9]